MAVHAVGPYGDGPNKKNKNKRTGRGEGGGHRKFPYPPIYFIFTFKILNCIINK